MIVPPVVLEAITVWIAPLAKLGLAAGVGYLIITRGAKAAVWLGDSRPVRWAVYAFLFLAVVGLLQGFVDGVAYVATGETATTQILDAVYKLISRLD